MYKYPFYTSCPSCNKKKKYHWSHAGCRGDMKIWDDGDLQCESCGESGFILDWGFDCGKHGENTYLGPNPQRLINTLSCLSEVNMPIKNIFNILAKIRKKSGI